MKLYLAAVLTAYLVGALSYSFFHGDIMLVYLATWVLCR